MIIIHWSYPELSEADNEGIVLFQFQINFNIIAVVIIAITSIVIVNVIIITFDVIVLGRVSLFSGFSLLPYVQSFSSKRKDP